MPKAFLSHSSLDQDRFVRGLAERLQANGVETWYAEWPCLTADSLTERIFEQGVGEADVFVVVPSKHSVGSNWVKAELAVGLVRQIERKCRLIPIVLDGADPPVALQGMLQRRIADPRNYEAEFDALLRSIFSNATAPPLGPPPSYMAAAPVRGLTPFDAVVFAQLGQLANETGTLLIDGNTLHERCNAQDLTDDAVIEAIHAIDRRVLIKEARQRGTRLQLVHPRPRMLREYVAQTTDVDSLERRLIAEIVNVGDDSRPELGTIATKVGVDKVVAHAVLERLDGSLCTLSARLGGAIYVDSISPLLPRELDR